MKEMPSLVSQRVFTIADNRQGRGSALLDSLAGLFKNEYLLLTVTQFYCPPHKHVGLSSSCPQPRCNTSYSVSCPLRSFLKITASALLLREGRGWWALSRILQREKSDDCSSDEWTVKHYLWFRGFFLKVQLRGSSQTSTTAAALLPRRRFKWQSHADGRTGCFATKPNKNDIITQDERMLWFIGADQPKRVCCFLCVFFFWSAKHYEIRMEDSLQRSSKTQRMYN